MGYKLTGPGPGQGQARPSPTFGFWPGLWFFQAQAASSQAKAGDFRPSRSWPITSHHNHCNLPYPPQHDVIGMYNFILLDYMTTNRHPCSLANMTWGWFCLFICTRDSCYVTTGATNHHYLNTSTCNHHTTTNTSNGRWRMGLKVHHRYVFYFIYIL